MADERHCTRCGKDLPADAPQGMCPQCLMQIGLPSEADPHKPNGAGESDASTPLADFLPPSPEELAEQFPQLQILELLGKGGMGAVYKARQKHLERDVALKILPPKIGGDPAFSERFLREARSLARLNHPHIVTVHDFGQTESGLYYFLMEFVDGPDLRSVISAGKMSPVEALAIVPQICEALQFAHEQGIVHRDIKPENILMDQKGRVKIADFGLARLLDRPANAYTLTAANQRMGTPLYMAPEQVERPHSVDHRADIYSLGVVFYEMLTGELPIGLFSPPSKKVRIDVRLDGVVLRTLEKEPELRYQNAMDVKTEVETISSSPQQPAPSPQRQGRAGAAAASTTEFDEFDAEAARRRVRAPAICLRIFGILNMCMPVFAVLLFGYFTLAGPGMSFLPSILELLIICGFGIPGLLAFLAGSHMLKLRSYSMAMTGAIIAMLPCSPLWILGLAFGIWSLVVLNDDNVRAAFENSRYQRGSEGGSGGRVVLTVFIILIVLGGLLLLPVALFLPLAVSHKTVGPGNARVMRAEAVGGGQGMFATDTKIGDLDFPMGSPSYVDYSGGRPVLTDECIEMLGLESVRADVDAVLAEAYSQYMELEAKYARYGKSGNTLKGTIKAFPDESEAFLRGLWADLDAVLSEPQRQVCRGDLPLGRIFGDLGFGRYDITFLVQRKNGRFEYNFEYSSDRGSGSGSGTRSTVPWEFRRLWNAGAAGVAADSEEADQAGFEEEASNNPAGPEMRE